MISVISSRGVLSAARSSLYTASMYCIAIAPPSLGARPSDAYPDDIRGRPISTVRATCLSLSGLARSLGPPSGQETTLYRRQCAAVGKRGPIRRAFSRFEIFGFQWVAISMPIDRSLVRVYLTVRKFLTLSHGGRNVGGGQRRSSYSAGSTARLVANEDPLLFLLL